MTQKGLVFKVFEVLCSLLYLSYNLFMAYVAETRFDLFVIHFVLSKMSAEKGKLYQNLYESYVKAHYLKKKSECQKNVNAIWNSVKKSPDVEDLVAQEVQKLKRLHAQSKLVLDSFWMKASEPKKDPADPNVSSINATVQAVRQLQHSTKFQIEFRSRNQLKKN